MARIVMRSSQKATFAQVLEIYVSAITARVVKDKTIATYKHPFHAISKRLIEPKNLGEYHEPLFNLNDENSEDTEWYILE